MLDIEFKRVKDVQALEQKTKNAKVKIVAGLRRAGKSYLLNRLFKEYLVKKEGLSNENFEIKDFSSQDEIRDVNDLRSYLNGLTEKDNLKFIFLDEPQEIGEQFAEIILKFHKMHKEYQIYITGSNSKTLSDDIVNYFGDDGDPYFVDSLSYNEIITALPNFSLDDFFMFGGLPVVLVEENQRERIGQMKQLCKNLYLTDIENRLFRLNILSKFSPFEAQNIIRSICSNITSPVSVSGLVTSCLGKGRVSGSKDRNAFSKDCLSIVQEAENSYLLYKFIYPHNQLGEKNPNAWETHQIKYYCYDIGLLRTLAVSLDVRGAVLENAVYLELHRRGIDAKPYIEYELNGNERNNIDFSFDYNGRHVLIQVTYEINIFDENREVKNLLAVKGDYEKYIVFVSNLLDEENGIKYLEASKFFKEFI